MMKNCLFFSLLWAMSFTSQAEDLQELSALYETKSLPTSVKFKAKIPPNTFDRVVYEKERIAFDVEVNKKLETYKVFDFNISKAERKINGLLRELSEINSGLRSQKSSNLLKMYQNEKNRILKENNVTEKELFDQKKKLDSIKRWRDDKYREFGFMTDKARHTFQSEISMEAFAKMLKRSAEDFNDCSISNVSFDKVKKEVKFSVKKGNDLVEYTLSSRLPIVISPDSYGYQMQFKRDAAHNRGNLSIADAKFEHELTQLRMTIGADGFPHDMFFNSLNMDRTESAASNSSSIIDIVKNLISTPTTSTRRTSFHNSCHQRKDQAVARARSIGNKTRGAPEDNRSSEEKFSPANESSGKAK